MPPAHHGHYLVILTVLSTDSRDSGYWRFHRLGGQRRLHVCRGTRHGLRWQTRLKRRHRNVGDGRSWYAAAVLATFLPT